MKSVSIKHILLFCIVSSVVIVLAALIFNHHHRSGEKVIPSTGMRKLPADVEAILDGYNYSETNGDITIKISGKRIIRRGREMLGLRSNVVKSNFFQDIRGTFRTAKGVVEFSASDAEWDGDSSRPLNLKMNVVVIIDGKTVPGVKYARIYFKRQQLDIRANENTVYHL